MRLALFTFCSLLIFGTAGFGQAGKKEAKKPDEAPPKQKELLDIGGKSVLQWTREFASKDPSKREHAMRMVMMFSPNQAKRAVGPLLKELEKHNKPKRIDLSVRISGCVALGTILSSIPPPKKDEKEDKDDLKHVEEAVKLLRSFCKDTQVIVRTRAVQALAQLARRYPPLVTPALPEVIHVADDYDTWEARQAGLETLTMLAMIKAYQNKDKPVPLQSPVWKTFQARLSDNSQEVRLTALKSLSQFSQPPATLDKMSLSHKELLKHIESVAHNDPQPSIRIWGHLTLMTLQHHIDQDRLKPIVKMLEDPKADLSIRIQAAQVLGTIGGQLQALKKVKKEDRPKIEPKIGKGVEEYIFHSLLPTLRDESAGMVGVGMHALAQSDPATAVGPVVDVLRRKETGFKAEDVKALKAEAAKVLAGIGKEVRAAKGNPRVREKVFDALQQTLGDSDVEIVGLGMNAMAHADPLGAVDPVVNILLKSDKPVLRAEAAKVLAGISVMLRFEEKPAWTKAEVPLITKLKDQEPNVVINCINALAQMGSLEGRKELQRMSVDSAQQEVIRYAAKDAVKVIGDYNNPKKKLPQAKGKVVAPR